MNAREVVNMIAVLIFLLEWAERFFLLSYNKSIYKKEYQPSTNLQAIRRE